MIRNLARAVGLLVLNVGLAARGADIPRPEHPRPDAVRPHWTNLNGNWDFRFDPGDEGKAAKWFQPGAEGFDRTIVVPFPWESELSGIRELKGPKVGWYRRTFNVPADFPKGDRVWLRFEAVDWEATAWVNGQEVAHHEGGYTPFEADITDALKKDGANTLVVRAFDPTDPSLPTGKQVGWYTPSSGIWQTVWLESRPRTYIKGFTIRTEIQPPRALVTIDSNVIRGLEGQPAIRSDDPTLNANVQKGERVGFGRSDVFEVQVREPKLWTPDSPHLYDVTLELKDNDGKVIDSVQTYFGLRTIGRGKLPGEDFERVLLNGKPIYLRGALDQSFNPKGIYTAPGDAFLKKDIELAKSFGTNFLRIHIKPDEPRRLYWADRLGMLIMEDMPNTWQQNVRARNAWEQTMREVVARDRNHPAIFAWVDFNETWGLGRPDAYKKDQNTQAWVRAMVAATRSLDPTRLVEDNSPCNYDHVEGTDLNSWHFYIDDHDGARRHVEEVVERSEPGSAFNYCPGQAMNSAPLINSEYGAVSAGGGDRDISWGFRDLTNLLRRHPKIQGYIYTELDDIEWEHNGFVNYDRTPKVFGYDAFVPGMTVADLQGADFIGYEGPPAVVAKVGETIRVPLFVSHYSDRKGPPTLKWWISGFDDHGEEVKIEPRSRKAEWSAFGVKEQKRLGFKIDGPFVGALALTLEDPAGKRIAANFVNLVVKPEKEPARVEAIDEQLVALRFDPADYFRSRWSEKSPEAPAGKAVGRGQGSFLYKIQVPEAIAKAKPDSFELLLEASARAGRERVDWPERTNAQDNPQTDTRKWSSSLEVSINGRRIARYGLPDDPADARGVLSHLARVDHGSYGEKIRLVADLPDTARADIAAGQPLIVRLAVAEDADHHGGLALFGATTGRYPFDPTLILHTEKALPADLGVKPDAPVTVDVAASRKVALLGAGDVSRGEPATWSYTTEDPGDGWAAPDFDDSAWKRGQGGFGTPGTPGLRDRTRWETGRIWLRSKVDVPDLKPDDALTLHIFHDEDVQVFVNGKALFRARGYVTAYRDVALNDAQKALFHPGANVIAVQCRQTGGGQGIDVGLSILPEE